MGSPTPAAPTAALEEARGDVIAWARDRADIREAKRRVATLDALEAAAIQPYLERAEAAEGNQDSLAAVVDAGGQLDRLRDRLALAENALREVNRATTGWLAIKKQPDGRSRKSEPLRTGRRYVEEAQQAARAALHLAAPGGGEA